MKDPENNFLIAQGYREDPSDTVVISHLVRMIRINFFTLSVFLPSQQRKNVITFLAQVFGSERVDVCFNKNAVAGPADAQGL